MAACLKMKLSFGTFMCSFDAMATSSRSKSDNDTHRNNGDANAVSNTGIIGNIIGKCASRIGNDSRGTNDRTAVVTVHRRNNNINDDGGGGGGR